MAVAETAYRHILLDESGVPVIAGANTKVAELIAQIHLYGLSPEELCYQLPHLSLGQIYSALAYYWDHREEIEWDLYRRSELAERLRGELGQPPLVERLKQRRLLWERKHREGYERHPVRPGEFS